MQPFNHISGNVIAVDDADIYYEEIGSKSDPVLLLLHGGLNNIELFNQFLMLLPEQFRVIGIDSRGHGRSTLGTKTLTYELLQKEVETVLAHLNITELSIVGFSNGGTTAYRLACFTDIKIDKLVTVGAAWHTKYIEHLLPLFTQITLDDWKQQCPQDYESYQRLNPSPDIATLFFQAMRLALDTSATGRPNDAVEKIASKILAIRGELDPIVSEESLTALCARADNAQYTTISSAGHDVFATHSKELAQAISNFLQINV